MQAIKLNLINAIMLKNILNLDGVQELSKESQKLIQGQGFGLYNCNNYDLSLCGCSCTGTVTGPKYCSSCLGCLQVITC